MYSNIFEYIPIYSFSNGYLCKILISNSCSYVVLHHFMSGNNLLLFTQLILPQNVLCIFLFWLWLWLFQCVSMLKPGYNYIFQAYSDWNRVPYLSVSTIVTPQSPSPQVDLPTLIGHVNLKLVYSLSNVMFSTNQLFEYYSNFLLTEYEYECIRFKILSRIRIRIYSGSKFQPNTNTNTIRFLKSTE